MNNLIKNAIWRSGQSNDPQFFLNTAPISFDQFEINGYRTCSITMQNALGKLQIPIFPIFLYVESGKSASVMSSVPSKPLMYI